MNNTPLLHPFKSNISGITIPETFTFPFYYEPHQLAEIAASELQEYLDGFKNWFYKFKFDAHEYQSNLTYRPKLNNTK